MCYEREREHHLVFQIHYQKTFDKGTATTTRFDEFIGQEYKKKKEKEKKAV